MNSSQPLVDERGAAFGRFASRVIEALNEAVEYRRSKGESIASISSRIGCHKSVISRVLNGKTRNPTLRTISDILWATRFEPRDFEAEPVEQICPNWVAEPEVSLESYNNIFVMHNTQTVYFNKEVLELKLSTAFKKPELEVTLR